MAGMSNPAGCELLAQACHRGMVADASGPERALILASVGRAFAECALGVGRNVPEANARLHKSPNDEPARWTTEADMKPLSTEGAGSMEMGQIARMMLMQAAEIAREAGGEPNPGGPWAKEMALGLELLLALAGTSNAEEQRMLADFAWTRESTPLAGAVAFATNDPTTFCAGVNGDCCSSCIPVPTLDSRLAEDASDGSQSCQPVSSRAMWTGRASKRPALGMSVAAQVVTQFWAQ